MVRPARILVVDDDKEVAYVMRRVLEGQGYFVEVAATGCEAVRKSQNNAYNVLFLDIRLPDVEGVDLLRLMKDTVPKARKIILTGYPSMKNAIASLNYGADAYLIKPVTAEKLLATVKTQLMLQEDDEAFSEEKITQFIEARIRNLSSRSS